MDREVSFSIVLPSGERYDHSYFVPSNIVDIREVKKYLFNQAFNDKIFIEIIEDFGNKSPEEISNDDEEEVEEEIKEKLPGRNKPCPCGSGKKYKLCCGKANVNF